MQSSSERAEGPRSSPPSAEPDPDAGFGVIAIVAFHFFPSHEVGAKRMSALAHALVKHGSRVAVFSAFEGLGRLEHNRRTPLDEYELHPVPDQRSRIIDLLVLAKRNILRICERATQVVFQNRAASGANNSQKTTRSWFPRQLFSVLYVIDDKKRWAWNTARQLHLTVKRRSISVIVVSGPPTSPLLGAVLVSRVTDVPVIVDLRDPICSEPSETSTLSPALAQWGRRVIERYVVTHASSVVTTSPTLCRRLQARYPELTHRLSCIPNGFDDTPLTAPASTGNRLVIVYAGTLYLNRNPFPFLEAFERLVTNAEVDADRVELLFAGDCELYEGWTSVRNWGAARTCGPLISILGRIDSTELKRLYQRATVVLNFSEGQPLQIPAKTFELLALGREVLMLCEPESDTATVAAALPGVWCVRSSDSERLDRLLLDLYQRHVMQGILRAPSPQEIARYSRAAQNERFIALIEACARGSITTSS